MNRLIVFIAVAALCGTSLADTIILRGKDAIRGVKVVEENCKEVGYLQGTAKRKRTVSSAEVLAVVYDNQPRDYRLGVEAFNLGDYVNTISRLKEVASAGGAIPWLKEYANTYLGRAYLASGDFAEAVKAFDVVLSAKPDTRWLLHVTAGLARAHVAQGSVSAAERTIENLKSKVNAAAGKIEPTWEQEADLILAEVYITAGKHDKASDACKRVASAAMLSKDEDVKKLMVVRAKRLEADAWLEARNTVRVKGVEKELRSLASGNPAALAAVRTTGAALALLGAEGDGTEALVEAAWDLARVHVENNGVVSEMPRTCYLLGLVHLRLAGTLDGAKDLAKGYFEETRRRFPESREALLAREQLKQM